MSLVFHQGSGLFEPGRLPRLSRRAWLGAAAGAALAAAAALGVAYFVERTYSVAEAARLDAIAEAAALAAAGAMADGGETPQAVAIGRRSFAEAAPNANPPEATAGLDGGFATATIAFLAPVGPIARRLGATPQPRHATVRVERIAGASHAFLTLDEAALPADCARAPQGWRLALNDAGLAIAVRCAHSAFWDRDGVGGFEVKLGAHRVVVAAAAPLLKPRPDGGVELDYGGGAWTGDIEIDGVAFPAVRGLRRYLDGQVSVETTNLDFPGESGNHVEILGGAGPTAYRLTLSFDAWQLGAMTIEATDAGRCAPLGGFLAPKLPAPALGRDDARACEGGPADPG